MYELYYWPGLPGRGEFIRLVLELAGVEYLDIGPEQGVEPVLALRGSAVGFAPPYLKDGHHILAQVPAVCFYLGRKHGLVPENELEASRVNQLFLTVMDVVDEVHDTHHPIDVALTYEEQKPQAVLRASGFVNGRLQSWLRFFEQALAERDWLVSENVCIADLALFQLTTGLEYAFPNAMAKSQPRALANHQNRVAELPNMATYLKSDRRQTFNQSGIFRQYPELDIEISN